MIFVGVTTITAAVLNIKNIYYPQVLDRTTIVPDFINMVLTGSILICIALIFYNAVPLWMRAPGRNSRLGL